ncbi:MAG TPA: radical SAM protein, partial [Steroidobacteraceae bacterium]|nr:radical SAM protein [Steroidobacteraceae bacterium]
MQPATASIALREFRDLWVHTGTACNLSCSFCHEGSSPGDTRLQAISTAEVMPVLAAAARAGAQRFILTGGEPLILKGIQELLARALQLRPVLVLTNGTAPWIRRSQQLASLHQAPHALSFRVSLDTPDEATHDAQRGLRNFRKAMEGLKLLHAAGFEVGITRQVHAGEDAAQVEARFRQLLRKNGLPADLSIVALPQLGALDATAGPPMASPVSEAGATAAPDSPLCARGRMLIRREGTLRLTACPLVDDAPSFDVPADIEMALST